MSTSSAMNGSKGGKAVYAKYGSEYMSDLGKKGAKAFYNRYYWSPAGTSGWALVRKSNDKIVCTVGVKPF